MEQEIGARNRTLSAGLHTPYEFVRAGFLTALGVALLAVLGLVVRHVALAALGIVTPFAFGTVFALLLDPVVDRLKRMGMGRGFAVFTVFCLFVLALFLIGAYGVPALVSQVQTLAENGPTYLARLQTTANTFLAAHPRILGFALPPNVDSLAKEFNDSVTGKLRASTGRIEGIVLGSLTTLLDAVITLIITFYLLLDIDRLRARLFYLAPARARAPMSQYARDIGEVFTQYLRGLVIVSALYGVCTILLFCGLSIAHHELLGYALLIGVLGGLLYTIPYLGPIITGLITFLVAFAAGGIGFGGIAALLTLGLNQVFDNIITPRIVGGGVGLHPVMSLFALSLGGALFGLWGLLLSVPIAASIQVILFRLFPRLTTPTPPTFLQAEGVQPGDPPSPRVRKGDAPVLPDDSPETTRNRTTDRVPAPAPPASPPRPPE